jgi:hypothetical protein
MHEHGPDALPKGHGARGESNPLRRPTFRQNQDPTRARVVIAQSEANRDATKSKEAIKQSQKAKHSIPS